MREQPVLAMKLSCAKIMMKVTRKLPAVVLNVIKKTLYSLSFTLFHSAAFIDKMSGMNACIYRELMCDIIQPGRTFTMAEIDVETKCARSSSNIIGEKHGLQGNADRL